jgi:reprolysin-like metallo-peptidase family M12B/Big-like domain-containing protein
VMRKLVHAPALGFCALLALGLGNAASAGAADIWQDIDEGLISGAPRTLAPVQYRTLRIDETALQSVLSRAPMEFTGGRPGGVELSLPMPDGRLARFRIEESPVMEPALAALHPEIHTYRGQGIDDPTATTRFGWTGAGFHAIILSAAGTAYIDPYHRGDTRHHISYFKRDGRPGIGREFECQVMGGTESPAIDPREMEEILNHRAGTLRAYRLAQAADFEYVSFHSDPLPALPSKALAMSRGIIPTINRVNGIYERDLSIHMNLVANNEDIVFDTPADPYTDQDGTSMLAQNQATCDAIIGPANYDIGHVFSTGGGGVAFLGVVCDDILGGASQKAGGVTGNPAPIGDGFDVDYVAHEMGHQFGGNHSFNGTTGSCSGSNRNAGTAYEVGSGSTVMAYAGICSPQDLQPHSDDNFHNINLQEIINFTNAGLANTCAVKTTVPNQAPVLDAGPNFTIPSRTPFTLTAIGSDPDGDAVTYNWEEFDLGPANAGTSDNGSSPIFRPFPSSTSPSRTFPRWSNILNNTSTYGEVLPTTSRTMTFRCTIRDNYAGAGGVHWDAMTVTVNSATGPFLVTAPNGGETWDASTSQNVTWNVAGTSGAPVNTANVDILLSTNGGTTFGITLASGVPNDGAQSITAPGVQTSQARVLVKGAGNIFFDVSNANFNIRGKPFANPDTASTTVDEAVAIDVLANDIDPNLDPLQITLISSPTAQGGTAVLQDQGTPNPADDRILYVPPTGFIGQDSFTYSITDGVYGDTASVTVVVNQATVGVDGPPGFRDLALRIRPNPVLDAVQLDFHLNRAAAVEIGVFSVQGRRVAAIHSGRLAAGPQSIRWDARARDGSRTPSGVYLLRMAIDGSPVTRRMVLVQ